MKNSGSRPPFLLVIQRHCFATLGSSDFSLLKHIFGFSLYNKEEVLNAILSKKIGECEVAKHIKSLKDIKELNLTDNKEYRDNGADKGDIYKDHNIAPFCCPVTDISMNGNHPYVWHLLLR